MHSVCGVLYKSFYWTSKTLEPTLTFDYAQNHTKRMRESSTGGVSRPGPPLSRTPLTNRTSSRGDPVRHQRTSLNPFEKRRRHAHHASDPASENRGALGDARK